MSSLGCLELFSNSYLSVFWPPGNWSSLPSDYHENHLIWVDSSLIVPLGFSFRKYSPWVAAGQSVQPPAWPSQELSSLSGLEPDDPLWLVLRLLSSNNKDQPPLPNCLENHLILADSIKVIPLACVMSLERLISPLFSRVCSLASFLKVTVQQIICVC